MLSDAIVGRANPWADTFDSNRLAVRQSMKGLITAMASRARPRRTFANSRDRWRHKHGESEWARPKAKGRGECLYLTIESYLGDCSAHLDGDLGALESQNQW